MFSRPFSGLMEGSTPSHLSPPIAPKRIASALSQALLVSSGYGSPCESIAAPPKSLKLKSNFVSEFSDIAYSAFTDYATISGPIPSPSKTVILYLPVFFCIIY
jgi:hypothetical protein